MKSISEGRAKLRVHRWLAAMLFVAGALLMAFKIVEDSEPGLVPLALVATSIGWFAAATLRARRLRVDASDPP